MLKTIIMIIALLILIIIILPVIFRVCEENLLKYIKDELKKDEKHQKMVEEMKNRKK